MNLKEVYKRSYAFLVEEAAPYNISKDMIDDFISNPDVSEYQDRKSAYKMFLIIMQDFNRYPNVIQYKKRESDIINILHDCDLNYIASLEPGDLLEQFRDKFVFTRDTMWLKYCKSIISGAEFMLCFQDDRDFIDTFDSFDKNDMTREALALLLSQKVYNMGFAIACNWLKELGYYKYAKPDTHTKDICQTLGLPSSNDLECFESIIKTANEAGVEAYKVDKVWWLICSGKFYRYNITLLNPRQRKERFLEILKGMTVYG